MNCNEAIEYIHSLEKFGINPGMERIRALCEELGNPQKKLKFIHVDPPIPPCILLKVAFQRILNP
jgi:folylpolyglutamate synthase/dihydropteroate synthase